MPAPLTLTVQLRPAMPADDPFLRRLYASTRDEELAAVPWTAEQKQAFTNQQFDARERHYHVEFPEADDRIVEVDREPAGRLDVARQADAILVVDLALAPAYRARGVGTALLESLFGESIRTLKPVRLHVEYGNRARSLYERLGFRAVSESPPYVLMEWTPGNRSASEEE